MCEWGETATLTIDGKPVDVDRCIAPIVAALNAAGVPTVASCCGHGKGHGNIALRDGRELVIVPDWETGRRVDRLLKEPERATPANDGQEDEA